MTEGPAGEYRTLSERLEAEKYRSGQYEVIEIDVPGIVDINTLFPEAVPAVSIRKDAWNNVYMRGAVFVDFDEVLAEGSVDYSGAGRQRGSIDMFTIPEGYRPSTQDGYSVTLAVQNNGVDFNLPSFLQVSTDGLVTVSVGGALPDGVTATETFLVGSTLSVILSGSFSVN